MHDEPQITIDDLLECPPRSHKTGYLTTFDPDHFTDRIFGRAAPVRRRFDPRRVLDRYVTPRAVPVAPGGGRVVYDIAEPDDLYGA